MLTITWARFRGWGIFLNLFGVYEALEEAGVIIDESLEAILCFLALHFFPNVELLYFGHHLSEASLLAKIEINLLKFPELDDIFGMKIVPVFL